MANIANRRTKNSAPSIIAKELAEKYRSQLLWDTSAQLWYRYIKPGIWIPENSDNVRVVVRTELDNCSDLPDGYGDRYLTSVINLLKTHLPIKDWDEKPGLLPFKNGVLNLETYELSPHCPGYHFRWCLPFEYNPQATCEPITEWLRETVQEAEDIKQVLLAYLNAIVKGRVDLQRYLEIIGPGSTGKSTFIWLATALVGEENTVSTDLNQLENNRFETANLYGKRLIIITDSDNYGQEVSVLKALTGQDKLRYERKGVQKVLAFTLRLWC